MKNLLSKLFFGATIIMMSSMISCKDKNTNETDMDGMDVDPVTPASTTGMPNDTTGMSTDTTTVTP